MKKEIAGKWVEALRSGKYEQAMQALRCGGGFCCLGVLCDVSGLGRWDERPDGGTREEHFLPNDGTEGSDDLLCPAVINWSGIRTDSGRFLTEGGRPKDLAELNDNGMPFSEIADIIEANWEQL